MIESEVTFSLTLNGAREPEVILPAHWRLIDYLHEIKGMTGTKLGCGAGYCKACTVCVRHESGSYAAIPACSTSLDLCNGWNITTIEGLADGAVLHPLQRAVIERDAFQCGYCAPGLIMEALALYQNVRGQPISKDEVDRRLFSTIDSHLCRCTGYRRYQDAFKEVIEGELGEPGATATAVTTTVSHGEVPLTRDPRWALVHLLHEAAEVENALMLQYLYAAFSIKRPVYQALAGFGHRAPGDTLTFLAVAIEEMKHLDTVNRFLVALGGRPNLVREGYPWSPNVYPFEFSLEPLSLSSLAKFLYVESAHDEIERDPRTAAIIHELLPPGLMVNRVGSIYERIRGVMAQAQLTYPSLVDWPLWTNRISIVQDEGEHDHYRFFRSVLLGEHPAFPYVKNPWALPLDAPLSPVAHNLRNPTAFPNRENSFPSGTVRDLAMLSNRHYWLTMGLLEISYLTDSQFHPAARRHMTGPLVQLAWHLTEEYGAAAPFDRCPMDYFAGSSWLHQVEWLLALLEDIKKDEEDLRGYLPAAYLEASNETCLELTHCLEEHRRRQQQSVS